MTSVSIVIVSWNVKDFLERCLNSIYSYPTNISFEVMVVDNASGDDTVAMLKTAFPSVILIENKKNMGFGRANNQGMRECQGKYVLILNPDTEIKPLAIEKLAGFLDGHEDAAAVGPKILNADGTIQLECARKFPSLFSEFFGLTTLVRRFPKNKIIGNYFLGPWDHNRIKEVDCLSGACMLVRRDILEKIDFFDEDFFMYGEDVDLCWRIQKTGLAIWYLPESEIVHYRGASSKKIAEKAVIYDRQSIQLFFRKHYGLLTAGFYKLMCFFVGLLMVSCCGVGLIFMRKHHKLRSVFGESKALLGWSLGIYER